MPKPERYAESHADRRRLTFRAPTGAQWMSSEPSGSAAASSRTVLVQNPKDQGGPEFASFTGSSDQVSATLSEPVTSKQHFDYIRNLIGQRQREPVYWPYENYVVAKEPSPSTERKSVVTSELSAPSSLGYSSSYSDEADNESHDDTLRTWEASDVHKSDTVVESSTESMLSLTSVTRNTSVRAKLAFAASAFFLLSSTALVAFYSYGGFANKDFARKAASTDNFETQAIYSAAFDVHLKTPSATPNVKTAADHIKGVRDVRAAMEDTTPGPFAGEDDFGKTTIEEPRSRRKVAVWEGKRIYEIERPDNHTESRPLTGNSEVTRVMPYSPMLKSKPPIISAEVTEPTLRTSGKEGSYTGRTTAKRSVRTRIILSSRNVKFCETKVCEGESVYLSSYLDWSTKPCTNFYDFVCRHWSDLHPDFGTSVDSILIRRVEEKIFQAFTSDVKPRSKMLKSEALMNMCTQKPFSENYTSTLLNFMGNLGLQGWPFQKDTKTLADVWKAAGLLLRNLGLATLVSVSVDADPESDDDYIISLGEPSLLIGLYGTKDSQLPEWYSRAISTCFKIFTRGKHVEIARKVRDFSSRLAEISMNRGNEIFSANKFIVVQLKHHSNLIQLLTLLFNNVTVVHSKMKVLVKSETYLKELRSVLHVSKGATMLNYLGFRALLHISPLLPDQAVQLAAIQMKEITGLYQPNWPRWRRCLRMFEQVAPTVFLLLYARTTRKIGNNDKLWALLNEIQASFVSNINSAPWMSVEDKAMMKDKLSMLKLEVFHKFWSKPTHKHFASEVLPDFESGSIIVAYKSIAKQFMIRKLGQINSPRLSQVAEWKGSVFDTNPVYDPDTDSIFIPVSMFDPSYMIDSESMLLQVPRVATKVIAALFKGIHHKNFPPGKMKWSVDTELGYHDVQKCLQKNYQNDTDGKIRTEITAETNVLDSMAILPAFKLFLKKVNKVNIEDYGLLTGLNITVKQLFFILYAKGFCETMDSERKKEVMGESVLNIGSERVNGALRNSFRFPTFWDCSSDSLMNPNQKCTVWTS